MGQIPQAEEHSIRGLMVEQKRKAGGYARHQYQVAAPGDGRVLGRSNSRAHSRMETVTAHNISPSS